MTQFKTFLLFPACTLLLSVARLWNMLPGSSWVGLRSPSSTTNSVDIEHRFTIELLSIDPLIFYINDFLLEEEINHLIHTT